jgi:transposase
VLAPADWPHRWLVPAVAMETTGGLPEAGRAGRLETEDFEGVLADARKARTRPRRPRRLTGLPSAGRVLRAGRGHRLLRGHPEVPHHPGVHPPPADLTGDRTGKQRAEKLLEPAAINVQSVITDRHGMTGRELMDHLIACERDPRALAGLALGKGG